MCACSPTNLNMRYCGKPQCRHPKTGKTDAPPTIRANGAQSEYWAREEDPTKPPPHQHASVFEGHFGFDVSRLDELVVRLKGAASMQATTDGAQLYLRLAHQAAHAAVLIRDVVDGMHSLPAAAATIAPHAKATHSGEPT
jgi:hypothetical protein